MLLPTLKLQHILTAALIVQNTISQSTISWLSDTDYSHFQTSFYNLDYNKDGVVTLNEAKLGILSILDAEYLDSLPQINGQFDDEIYANYHTFQPNKYNCVPSINSV